jgi:glucosamine-6-phosphate deaminase
VASETSVSGIRTIVADESELARIAAERILGIIRSKPDAVLLFPTGATPEGTYAALVSAFRRRCPGAGPEPSWSRARCLNMDEYWRLPPWHDQSYSFFMREHLYRWVDLRPENLFYPDSLAPTPEEACAAYERQVATLGGFDHVLFGIGVDGHLGFNEAGLARSRTQYVAIAESTRRANGRYFGGRDQVPTHAITAGLDTMLEGRALTLIALGGNKARAVRAMLTGPIGVHCPASLLREAPDRTLVLIDQGAASELEGLI